MKKEHGTRKHSPFSASGAERWLNCPGSVPLSKDLPDKTSPWALEGTRAHEILEMHLRALITQAQGRGWQIGYEKSEMAMHRYGSDAARFIIRLWKQTDGADLQVEERVSLAFIHPDMFGTLDSAVIDHYGTLHVFDYKYGAGHAVSPSENLQMIFYALALAHTHQWQFKNVRLWIIQPRVRGYDGPLFWQISILELKNYIDVFRSGVERVEKFPDLYVEGPWCHWCKAKGICPIKKGRKLEEARSVFRAHPIK